MEKIFRQGLLYDFYGELLTPHQRAIYEDAVYNDLSLGEIAEEQGISRQGVHDLIKRCDKILLDYESKLRLVEKFSTAKEKIGEIIALTKELEASAQEVHGNGDLQRDYKRIQENMNHVRTLSEDLMKEW